jgi:hypothetical protein
MLGTIENGTGRSPGIFALYGGIYFLNVLVSSAHQGFVNIAVKVVGNRTEKAYPTKSSDEDNIEKESQSALHFSRPHRRLDNPRRS